MKQIADYTRKELVDLLTTAALDILKLEDNVARLRSLIDGDPNDKRRAHGFKTADLEIALEKYLFWRK